MFGQDTLDLSLEAFVGWLSEHEQVRVGLLGAGSVRHWWFGSLICAGLLVGLTISALAWWLPRSERVCLIGSLFLAQTECYGGFVEVTGVQVFGVLADIERRFSLSVV